MYFFIWNFQNHIPLKHSSQTIDLPRQRFGTVYHHIKLHTSQTPRVPISTGRLWDHIKLHISQTRGMQKEKRRLLWDHIKLHISQTRRRAGNPAVRFTTICLSNMPLNFLSSFEACLPYKITYFSNRRERFLIPLKLVYHTKLHTSQTIWQAAAISPHACLP